MGSVATVKPCEVEVRYRLPANCFQPKCVDQVGVVKLVQEDWNNHLLGVHKYSWVNYGTSVSSWVTMGYQLRPTIPWGLTNNIQ